ncbi:hypothetical protein [Bradymonas sediminis]|nr:hypothetical protein [Bradymonas sediminis]TDP77693.1 hypothetical protein DFR33_101603 [Bradymonas sediminis]
MSDEEEFEDDEIELSDEDVELEDVEPESYDDDDDDDSGFKPSTIDDGLLEAAPENALKANPKRMTAAQRKQNKSLVEGIIDKTYFESPESAVKAFEKLREETDINAAKPYSIDVELTENDTVNHPKFGLGFVLELVSPTKVEILFEEGNILKLVCNQASRK